MHSDERGREGDVLWSGVNASLAAWLLVGLRVDPDRGFRRSRFAFSVFFFVVVVSRGYRVAIGSIGSVFGGGCVGEGGCQTDQTEMWFFRCTGLR